MCSRCETNFNLPPWTMNYYFGFPLNCTWYNNNAKKRNWEAIEVHIRHMGRNCKWTVAWWLKKNNPIKNIQASNALQALDQTIIHCLHTSKSVSEQANYISAIKQLIWFTKSLIGNTKYTERQKITLVYPINPKTRSSWNQNFLWKVLLRDISFLKPFEEFFKSLLFVWK